MRRTRTMALLSPLLQRPRRATAYERRLLEQMRSTQNWDWLPPTESPTTARRTGRLEVKPAWLVLEIEAAGFHRDDLQFAWGFIVPDQEFWDHVHWSRGDPWAVTESRPEDTYVFLHPGYDPARRAQHPQLPDLRQVLLHEAGHTLGFALNDPLMSEAQALGMASWRGGGELFADAFRAWRQGGRAPAVRTGEPDVELFPEQAHFLERVGRWLRGQPVDD